MSAAAERVVLGAPSAFADPVVRLDPTLPPPPDVEGLHGAVRVELRRAITAVGAGGRAQMVLVVGDPGMGKTHELVCLRREAQSVQRAFYVVDIPPLKEAGSPFRHLLQHFTRGLAGQEQLERLLWESLRKVAAALRATAWREGDEELARRLDEVLLGGQQYVGAFAAMIQGDRALGDLLYRRGRSLPPLAALSAEVGRVLCKLPDPDAHGAILDWLRAEELPAEELALLGVKSWLSGEARCFEALQALIRLCPTPVALCFDQLEATSALLGVGAFVELFNALMELYQQLPVCIVLMCQSQQWAELHSQLPRAALDRLKVLPPLAQPTGEQAVGLVASRLAATWREAGVTPPYPTYPFPPAWIDGFVRRVRPTLRRVLQECGDRLEAMRAAGKVTEPAAGADGAAVGREIDAGEVLARAHANMSLAAEERKDLRDPAQRQDRLRSVLVELLRTAAERRQPLGAARVESVDVPRRPRLGAAPPVVVSLSGGQRLALEVFNEKGVVNALKRLVHAINQHVADRGVLVRESAAPPLGDGKVTWELMDELGSGAVVWLGREQTLRLVGADLLLDAVRASEVSLGARAATEAEARAHLVAQPDLSDLLATLLGGARPAGP